MKKTFSSDQLGVKTDEKLLHLHLTSPRTLTRPIRCALNLLNDRWDIFSDLQKVKLLPKENTTRKKTNCGRRNVEVKDLLL